MIRYSDDGNRLLTPVQVEAPEGWDPAPLLPADRTRTWYSTADLIEALTDTRQRRDARD